jgi:hypothetical protein
MSVDDSKPQIKVIGAGLGRTGTKSLAAALDILGYKSYHFPLPKHAKVWADYAEGKASAKEAIEIAVKEGYDATCDQPMADVFQQQMELYPDAKVILTVRDTPQKWAQSWKVLMDFIEIQERPFSIFYPSFIQWIPFMRYWKHMRNVMGCHLGLAPGELIRGYRQKGKRDEWLEEQYLAHCQYVKKVVPADRLLEFNVKSGWGPLCQFLFKEIPSVPFPNVNESQELKRAGTIMKVVTYAWIPILASVVKVSMLRSQ